MNEPTIIPERFARIQALSLASGDHEENETQMCVMEAAAYVAGEPWSDHPQCACPVITAFMISWNDSLPTDADRSPARQRRPAGAAHVRGQGRSVMAVLARKAKHDARKAGE